MKLSFTLGTGIHLNPLADQFPMGGHDAGLWSRCCVFRVGWSLWVGPHCCASVAHGPGHLSG